MRLVCADSETTGIDVHNDRIVTFFVGVMADDGSWESSREWLVNPGIPIPRAASDVHGVTDEAAAKGIDPAVAVREIWAALNADPELPIVFHNGSFDLSLLACEMRRYGIGELNLDGRIVLDTFIIDKAKDKYRKGSRKLGDVARHYGVEIDESALHRADYDCYLAGRIAQKLAGTYRGSLEDLTKKQVEWACEQRTSLQDYFKRSGRRNDDGSEIVISQGWPIYDSVVSGT